MSPADGEVSTALEAVSVMRWLWALKRDRGEPADVVSEAHAAYARARAMLLEALRREVEGESGPGDPRQCCPACPLVSGPVACPFCASAETRALVAAVRGGVIGGTSA